MRTKGERVAARKQSSILNPIRTLMNAGSIGDLTDGQLLERFATGRGEAKEIAFAALVERHGPMVLRVCRGVLANSHDTQDAFQATFLVLVKKARGLWVKDSLGAWLHQVAFRTASSARKDAFRRRRHERRAAELAAASTGDYEEGAGPDVERLLHAEIDRLPERYRVPIVLCDLEGRPLEQVARHLGWPIGTVKSRLSRGRDRLRDRLCRLGLFAGLEPIAVELKLSGLDDVIPTALVRSTTAAAVQFSISQSIRSATVAALCQGVLHTMFVTRCIKVVSVLLVAGATVSGVGLLSRGKASGVDPADQEKAQAVPAADMRVAQVNAGKFRLVVPGPGTIEVARRMDLLCLIEGSTTIIKIVPEGARVKKGEVVCELDSASLRDQLINQKITTQGAESTYRNAMLSREIAQIALKEYQEGVYPLNKATVLGEIKLAEAAIQTAKDELERTRRVRQQLNEVRSRREGPTGSSDLLAELDVENRLEAGRQTLMREQLALERAQDRMHVLEQYTKDRMVKELTQKVDEQGQEELAKGAALDLQRRKESRLAKQIEDCRLVAPGNGVVVYYNDNGRAGQHQIEEGATVRERQLIVYIFDLDGPKQVNAKMPEAWVDRLAIGQKAEIKVDAFPDQTFTGEVTEIAPLPDPSNLFSSDIKVYTTKIRIEGNARQLVPGLTARSEVLVLERDDTVSVPTGAILLYDGKDHVAVKKAEGGFEWRDVTLGDSNGVDVVVTEGIKPGDQVVLEPSHLLTEEQRRRMLVPTPPASRKNAGVDRAKGKASGKSARSGAFSPTMIQKLRSLDPDDRAKMKNASLEEREAILRKGGFTDDEIRQFSEIRKRPSGPN